MDLALKEIRKNKWRYVIIAIVLISTIYLVLFTMSLSLGLRNQASSKLMNSSAQTYILSEDTSANLETSNMSYSHALEVEEAIDVDDSFILGVRLATMENWTRDTRTEAFDVSYFSMDSGETFFEPNLTEGRYPENGEEVIASQPIKAEGVELGDTIHDKRMNINFEIVGFTEDETHSYSPIVYVLPERFSDTSFWGNLTGIAEIQAIVTSTPPEQIPDSIEEEYNVDINSQADIIRNLPGLLAQTASFTILIITMYVIAGAIISMFFYIVTIHKKKEFGLLKAFGATTGILAKVIISQVLLISVISVVISVILILITSATLPSVVPFHLVPSYLIIGSIVFVLVALIGSLISLFEIAKVDPIETIGGNN